ncbi:MAG: MATE family efflux transporter [Chitinophagales bacterium]
MSKHKHQSEKMGVLSIPKLLLEQSLPASLGILVLSIYNIVDSIFVGKFVGTMALGAVAVVLPITFFISALGMAVGVGGGSIISRSLGAKNYEKAYETFGNQTLITVGLSSIVAFVSFFFLDEIILLFGGKGELMEPAKVYFKIILPSVPFLAWAMMSNNVFRAEGLPKIAMITMFIPAIVNFILDPLFIVVFDCGLAGAAWATSIAYFISGIFTFFYFIKGGSQMSLKFKYLKIKYEIAREIIEIGGVTFVRQATVSLLAIVLNNSLFHYGAEMAVSAYGIISRLMMFANFPVFGLTQGFLPIAGYNYGAKQWLRVRETIIKSILYGVVIATVTFAILMAFPEQIVKLFTNDSVLIQQSAPALRLVFLLTPFLIIQLISSAYYQAIGKALPALILTLLKQGIFLIPLVLLLPKYLGLQGIWYAFPLADLLTSLVSGVFISISLGKLKLMHNRI